MYMFICIYIYHHQSFSTTNAKDNIIVLGNSQKQSAELNKKLSFVYGFMAIPAKKEQSINAGDIFQIYVLLKLKSGSSFPGVVLRLFQLQGKQKKWSCNRNHHLLQQEPVRLSLWLTMQNATVGTWKPSIGLSNTLSVPKTTLFFSESCLSSGRSPRLPVSLSLAIFHAYVSSVNSTSSNNVVPLC